MEENKITPEQFVKEVEKFSRGRLKRKIELLRIYEEAVKYSKIKEFEDLAFTAKYVQGLLRVVRTGSADPEVNNFEMMKNDFSDNMKKTIEQIRGIISSGDDTLKQHFENTYFELTQESFINMSELLSDLEWAKMYMNDLKRR